MNQRIEELYNELIKIITPDTVFACIGAVKTTSYIDSIGSQVGDRLTKAGLPYVYGTTKKPYNGLTACGIGAKINRIHHNQVIVAIDCCISYTDEKLYKIGITNGGIKPGAGMNKKLPIIGDYAIKAFMLREYNTDLIMNSKLMTSGKCDFYVQETNKIVDIISTAIIQAYNYICKKTIENIFSDKANIINVNKLL